MLGRTKECGEQGANFKDWVLTGQGKERRNR